MSADREQYGWADYGGPDDFAAERRAMQHRRPTLTGYQALVRVTEFRPEWLDADEDDEP